MPGTDPGASRDVVVTGLGAVSPLGWSLSSFWDGLRSGRTAVGPFDRFDHSDHRTHVAAQVDLSAEPRDIADAYRAGANSYLVKPTNLSTLTELAIGIRSYWLRLNVPPNEPT